MSTDFATPVKNILKTWTRGAKLAKKFGKSASTALEDNAEEVAQAVEDLQRALERDSEAVTVEYKQCLESWGERFTAALLEDKTINSQLKDLRADLMDQINDIQDLVDEPEDFEAGIFVTVQTESQKISKECIKLFQSMGALQNSQSQNSLTIEVPKEDSVSSRTESRHGSISSQATSSTTTRLRIFTEEIEYGPSPKPKSSWLIESPIQGERQETDNRTSKTSESLEPVSETLTAQDPSTFISTAKVDSLVKANYEFLERRRQSRVDFYGDKRASVASSNEKRQSSFDIVSPISPSSPKSRSGEVMKPRRLSDYAAFVEGHRSSGSENKRTSVASSLRTTSTTPGEVKHTKIAPVAEDEFFTSSRPASVASSSADGVALAATLKVPGYGKGVEDGLEAVNPIMVDVDNEKIPLSDVMPKPHTPTSSMKSIDSPMRHDSSFYKFGGFCEGARAMLRGELGHKISKRPTGTYGSVDYAKCIKCSFEISISMIEKDARMDVSGIYGNGAIRWRQQFLTKSHVRNSAAEDPLYACIFCIEDRRTPEEHDATVFFTPTQLLAHLARHPRPLPAVAGITTLYGKVSADTTNFDIHFMQSQPTVSKYNLTEIAPEVAVRPSANATSTYHPKTSRSNNKDPDGNPTLHFAAGARILGIRFPDHFGGAWCVGYHDGEKGSFPSAAISLDLPSREDVFMSAQSSLVAYARWEFKPKEAKEGGWLRFAKGEKITNIGYTFQDQWCWSGQTKNGKWGLFPAAFVEGLQDGGSSGLGSGKSSGLLGLKKLSRNSSGFSMSRNSLRSSVGRSGSSSKVPTVKTQPGLEVVVNGVTL